MMDRRERHRRVLILALAGLACVAWATACGDGAVEPSPPPPPDPARPTSVTVEPSSATLTSLGETVVFRATVNDQRGAVFPGTVTWSSSDETVVTVNAGGTATAVANGSGTVTATFQSLIATAAVEVAQALAALETVSGDGQQARVGAPLPDSVVVRAVDAGGSPIKGVTVVFAAGEGHGTADPAEAVTDAAGLARTVWTLGDAPGAQTLAASVANGPSAQIAARGLTAAEVVHAIEIVSGGDQTADLGAALDDSIVVRAVDAEGAPVEGAAVVFTPGEGHGTADPAEAFTDSEGLARTAWTLGKDVGKQTLVAVAGDVSLEILAYTVNPDRAALVALYEATDGPNWVDSDNWLTDAPLEDWYGVDADASGRVVSLDLSGRWDAENRQWVQHGLAGAIPPELGNLGNLEALNLSINGLTGTIPPELGKLANLKELNLSLNLLFGIVPPRLGELAKLEWLVLNDNVLTGAIPAELGRLANLTRLDLQENELTGPIPPEFGDLANLRILRLRFNSLTGPIPPWLGNLAELTQLTLGDNDLTGPIPPELGNLGRLRILSLDENSLSGPIPPELGNLDNLSVLLLYDNSLTGPIPPVLGDLTGLVSLSVWGNSLSGSIPQQLGNLLHLTRLDLSGNNLTGPIPSELGNLERLESISLSGNLLTGSIPLSFTELHNLASLGCQKTEGVCLPATDAFREWARQIEARGNIRGAVDIPFCDDIDKEALQALYEAANGSGWTRSDGWLVDDDLDRWHGVRTDLAGRVSDLDLNGNQLSGYVPEVLGRLVNLKGLGIGDNALSGQLPLSLTGLALEEFDYGGTSLCAAEDADFAAWLNGVPNLIGTGIQCPPFTEREILEWLYRNTGGSRWRQRAGWLTDTPLGDWHGVDTDATGRVIGLHLGHNGLSGSIPVELAELSELRILNLDGNDLAGTIPPELGGLSRLEALDLARNQFSGSIPAELGQLSQLRGLALGFNRLSGAVPPELGGLGRLERLDLGRNQLGGDIPPELGALTNLARLNLADNVLSGPLPPELGDLSGLVALDLARNLLSGSIPSEFAELGTIESIGLVDNRLTGNIPPWLGALDRLAVLGLSGNQLTGPIPANLGGLANLREFRASGNDLSGSIPAELGSLPELRVLDLANNNLSGSIPAALGGLASLATLDLGTNELSGPLLTQLGLATKLEGLDVRSNALSGPVPPEFGNLGLLESLIFTDNAGLAGPLPADITALSRLDLLMAGGTGLCRPMDTRFDAWFGAIADRYLVRCRAGPDVYLVQTVQSWGDPVPLLAGEPALLRVFVTAQQDATVTMPEVKATFYVNGAERHTASIAAGTQTVPHRVREGDLALSANIKIPDWVIVPDLEMVIEVDPEHTLDPALGVTRRIPAAGRMAVEVRYVPPFPLTLVPILSGTDPDSSVVEDVAEMAADPDGHALLHDTRTLLPVAEIAVAAREPVTVTAHNARTMLRQVAAMRLMEGGSGYWMGVWDAIAPNTNPGVSYLGGWESVSVRRARTIAHELGHSLSLRHAPCGSPALVDPWFPHPAGSIGAWGFDFERNELVPPHTPDIMSYCLHSGHWISDYFFNKALDHRLSADTHMAAAVAGPTRTLLLWGGRDTVGIPYLDPTFVVDAVPSLPPAGTEYTIEGTTADGTPLFSYTFDMPDIANAEGEEAGFVFALPVQAGWADDLAGITLSGPGGSVTLDDGTDRPMAILRDPQTGRVRGFLSDIPAEDSARIAAARATGATPPLEVLISRGIPDAAAWRR